MKGKVCLNGMTNAYILLQKRGNRSIIPDFENKTAKKLIFSSIS